MKSFLTTLALTLSLITFANAAGKAPFQIVTVDEKRGTNAIWAGSRQQISVFRIQFRINEDNVKSLDLAKIYFFNDKKELVDTLTNFAVPVLNQGNVITNLSNLDKNKLYTLEFAFTKGEVNKTRYMLAVIGTKDQVVAKITPSSEKASSLEFPEKAKLVE
jgi:hypothetical protein